MVNPVYVLLTLLNLFLLLGPVAFLLLASGLDKHGTGSSLPVKYSHMDIAGSTGRFPITITGAPILTLASSYLL